MSRYIVLQSQDFSRVNLDQHLQAKLLQLPADTNVILSNYRVTQFSFKTNTVPKLSTATIDAFVNALSAIPYQFYGNRSVLTALIPRLTQGHVEKLASSKAYEFVRTIWNGNNPVPNLLRTDQVTVMLARSMIRYGNPGNSDVQRAILQLPAEEVREYVRTRPEIITALVGQDRFDTTLFALAAESDNIDALMCVVKHCDDTRLVTKIIAEKRHLFDTVLREEGTNRYGNMNPDAVRHVIAQWLTDNLNNIELSIGIKPLVKEESHA